MHTLLTWLGTKDLDNMLNDEHAAISSIATKSQQAFDKIVILSNKDEEKWGHFERFLKKRMTISNRPANDIQVYKAHINSPIDYQSIAKVAERWISKLSDEAETLSINLTSGTPAMTTLSVLIGKSKSNVNFLQASPSNEIIEVNIPIDFAQAYVQSAAKGIASKVTSEPRMCSAFNELTAYSDIMKSVVYKAQKISGSELPALILGETGTGKELMAKAIHQGSLRAQKPIRVINCGALAENIVDSTLFGHKKGAFTGAEKDHPGLFEQADGGTLFLDEVGELSLNVQVKLLRALQQGEITRLGDTKNIIVNVRIIAATHQDLPLLVAQGKFREDLFYRLAVGIIKMPALRDRLADMPYIVNQLVEQINHLNSKHPNFVSKNISEKGINVICSQPWPGNIRELWSTLNRAFLWAESSVVSEQDILNAIIKKQNLNRDCDISMSYHDKVDIVQLTDDMQKKYVKAALKASGNVKKHATKMLGLKDHQTLTNWIKRLGIDSEK
ncbi:sigma-54 interaction domain-containing protein [Shewanella gaetbuli]|uniref:Sigma-54 dependent transcriptional regulator n=1 Tax=Shewanella gaetbuli TaxID=220752 RepID=A0A9X1ZLL9_9GAMM|nr:sigma-54 dependent transcriptional regulator [Shewanella gaetbuli]MCL1143232.1 sigma-54 dependent transcriptional regulator [Shewanella gaetbuli]